MRAEKDVAQQMIDRHDGLAEPAVADRYVETLRGFVKLHL
jgi:hypothetical protein